MHTFDGRGLRLAYDDSDIKNAHPARPPLVLLHGWLSRRADLAPVGAAFATSHRVVSVDLPGHGDSEVPDGEDRLAIASEADDVAALCDELGLRQAVLVGHSSGAAVAAELAVRRPDLAAVIVALDGVLIFRPETLELSRPLMAALRTPMWREAMRAAVESSYLPTDDAAVMAGELAALEGAPQHVVAGVADQVNAWDAQGALGALGAARTPMLYVAAGEGMADLEQVGKLVPQLQVARVVGVGHMQMLATPEQTVAAMERFLTIELGRAPVDNRAPVLELFNALPAGQLDAIDRLVSADFVDHGAPPGSVPPGPEGYRTVLRLLLDAMQMRWELLGVVAEPRGERVACWVRNTGRHVGEFFGIPPTGREFDFEAMHVFRVEDGVIREHWAVRDDLALFRQLGLVPEQSSVG